MADEKNAAQFAPPAGAEAASKAASASSEEGKRRKGKLHFKPSRRMKANEQKATKEPMEAASAMAAVKRFDGTKFNQAVDVVFHLGIDTKQADQLVRGSVSLPKGIGKTKRVVAFCTSDQVEAAKAAGAVEAGGQDLVSKIEKGWFEFDVAVASPDMMREISKLGRVLGPKGLMPSPKAGTVTKDVVEAVADYSAGKVEYRADKGGNVHATIGKMSFPEGDLLENYEHLLKTIEDAKPASVKHNYIKSISISGTMTPGIRIKYSDAAAAATA